MELVHPVRQYLRSYDDALRQGWSPDNLRRHRGERRHSVERFFKPAVYGGTESLRYRILPG